MKAHDLDEKHEVLEPLEEQMKKYDAQNYVMLGDPAAHIRKDSLV
jgi:hypothetical protein